MSEGSSWIPVSGFRCAQYWGWLPMERLKEERTATEPSASMEGEAVAWTISVSAFCESKGKGGDVSPREKGAM